MLNKPKHLKTKKRPKLEYQLIWVMIAGIAFSAILSIILNTTNKTEAPKDPNIVKLAAGNCYVSETEILSAPSTKTWDDLGIIPAATKSKSQTEPVLPDEPVLPEEDPKPVLPEETPEPALPDEPDEGYILRDDIIDGKNVLSHEAQKSMQKYCEKYPNVEYALAIAIADVESDFNPDATSETNDFGLMQVNKIHEEYMLSLGYDIHTLDGNIGAAIRLISGHLDNNDNDKTKAVMCYNNGPGGAAKLWKKGVTETDYTKKIMAAYQKWDEFLNS